jgi:hypothetical protein
MGPAFFLFKGWVWDVSFSFGGGLKGEAIEKQFDFYKLKQLLVCPTCLIKSVLCIFKSVM